MTRILLRIALLALPLTASAQSPVRVNGVAWDSLSSRPLASAFVALGTRSTVADSAGRFTFEGVPTGMHRITMQHDVLDSLGLPEISASVTVRDGEPIRIATPSSRTMWRRVCPKEQPNDSGFVFGVIRDARTRKPISGATIIANWIEVRSAGRGVEQKGWQLSTESVGDGTYVICGMPLSGARIEAAHDSSSWAGIDVVLTDKASVRRFDLALVPVNDSTANGTIRGSITSDGKPVANARVETDGVEEVRSGADGGFVIRNVRAGTRQVYVTGIGFEPTSRVVELAPGDTARLAVTVGGLVRTLDSVVVTASVARAALASQFGERMRRGIGYYKDSTQLAKYLGLEGVFSTMPSVVAQRPQGQPLNIRIGGQRSRGIRQSGGCQALVFIDRMRSDAEHLASYRPSDLAGIEVYRTGEMPIELMTQFGLNPFSKPCAVVAWTKQGWK